jgi:Ca2+-binding RTX toxin-like protein
VRRLGRGSIVGTALICAGFALGAAPAQEEDEGPRCHGRTPTIVGTTGNDSLHGTNKRDVIWAGPGNDFVHSGLGNDLVCGEGGTDVLHGGRGNDEVDGGAGDADQVIGDLGDDKVMGGPGDGDDVAGSLGIDMVNGGPGDFDLVHGDYGYDRVDGGPGVGDIVSFATDVATPKGAGVWVSLPEHKARGDGHDRVFRVEAIEGSAFDDVLIGDKRPNSIDGGAGDDVLRGGGGGDLLLGGQGSDKCSGAKGSTDSCGREARLKASAYVHLDGTSHGGGGLAVDGGGGDDDFTVAFDQASRSFGVTAKKGIAVGPGCERVSAAAARCPVDGPARWLMADLGPGDDRLRVEGDLGASVGFVRLAGGPGDDVIRGGPEDTLIEAGPGSDRLHGGPGADGLIGGLPGPTFLYGEENGDLLAAGGGCAGGAIVGGPGKDDASFAETQAHGGILYISFPRQKAWVEGERGCSPVRLDPTNEDMEGSFDWDVLIGDSGPNAMLGQPGKDRFFGNGGDDIIDARDGVRDFSIQCGRARSEGRAITDSFDPPSTACAARKHGTPVPGLNNDGS